MARKQNPGSRIHTALVRCTSTPGQRYSVWTMDALVGPLPTHYDPAVKQIRYASGNRFGATERGEKNEAKLQVTLGLNEVHPSLQSALWSARSAWAAVSCGTKAGWVMAAVIDDGIAQRRPLLYILPPISFCLLLCLTASGGGCSVWIGGYLYCPSSGETAIKIGSVISGITVTWLA